MSAILGIATPALGADGISMFARTFPSEAADTMPSVVSAGSAGFCASAPARPAVSPNGNLLIALEGYITNVPQLCRRRNLPETDVFSLLFDLCSQPESPAWEQLEGNFAFAFWDNSRKRLILAADRIGSRPLCWCRTADGIAFASRPGMLAALSARPREYDAEALRYYLSMQYLPVGRSAFPGIPKLLPGEILTFDLQTETVPERRRPVLSLHREEKLSFSGAAARLRELLTSAVERALNCAPDSRPAGVLLSGGIDSAIIAGIAAKLAGPGGIQTFTIGTDDSRYDERADARKTMQSIRNRGGVVTHREFHFGPEDLDLLRKRTLHWGEPYADSSLLPTAKLLSQASEHAALLLGGDGGDELFCGYDRYRALRCSCLLDGWADWLRPLIRLGAECLPDWGDRNLCGRLRRFGIFLGERSTTRYFSLLDRCPEPLAASLPGERFAAVADPFSVLREEDSMIDSVEAAARWDVTHYLPGDTLLKSAIASMGTGAVSLSPMLDREIVDFALSLPLQYKMSGGIGKRLLRAAFPELIPAELRHLPKRGFGAPVADYLRGPWKEMAAVALFDSTLCSGGWFRRAALETVWREHQSGVRDRSYLLWGAVQLAWFLEAEAEKHIDKGHL